MNQGYVRVHRKTLDSQVFQNEGLFKVWMWCLLRANHKEEWVSIKIGRGTTEVHLLPGQFIFGRKTAAKSLKMKEPTVQKRIKKLVNMGNCIIESITHYSIITVVNWAFYQGGLEKVSSKVSTKYQPSITDKNDKNNKEDIYSEAKPHNSLLKITQRIIDHLNQTGNRNFTYSKANLRIIQARLNEGHTEQDCKKVINVKWADPDFNKKFFRPSTLFRPTKFEGYLNEESKEQSDKSWDI